MQPLTYQQTSGFSPTAVINRSQTKQAPGHEKIRDAVRAWSAADNQDVVAALIVNEYREQGGGTIDFPDDVSRARQKLFRFLDNKFDSEKYRNNVRELTPAILAVLPLEYRGYLVEQDSFMTRLAQIINGVFSQLLATFPASLANRDQNELNEIRRQWVLAFRENGITTMEQVNAGMRVARRQNRPFLPSPGQFVAWCREEASVTAGLPNASELVDMVYEYCRKRGLYPDAESYPWKSNAHYWLVTNLYQNMRGNALTDAELRRKAADELACMTARINRGEAIPEPVKQLPVMGGRPLNRVQALAKIAEIKAKFGLKGASV